MSSASRRHERHSRRTIAILVTLGVAFASVVVAIAVIALQMGERQAETRTETRFVYDRGELKAALKGKTIEQTIRFLGKPSRSMEGGSSIDLIYRRISRDPVTGQIDDMVMISFNARTRILESVIF